MNTDVKCENCGIKITYETDGKIPVKHICSKCKNGGNNSGIKSNKITENL